MNINRLTCLLGASLPVFIVKIYEIYTSFSLFQVKFTIWCYILIPLLGCITVPFVTFCI